jgi:hypothetical protein
MILVVDDAATLRTIVRRVVQGAEPEGLGLEALAGVPDIEHLLEVLELPPALAPADPEPPKPLAPSGPRRVRRV